MKNKIMLFWRILKTLIVDIFFHESYVLLYAKSTNENNNFGDDIGDVLVGFLTSKKLIHYRGAYISRYIRKRPNYLIVGSIIPQFSKHDTIIWGSGVGESTHVLLHKPKHVLAVRGPLTRQYLLNNGVECPEIYGDPALLLSMFYNPSRTKKYKIGFIPHFLDQTDAFFQYIDSLGENVKFIDVRKYGTWQNFIDLVCSCDFICSSSLHGLIIADTFGIPNIWCQFTHKMEDDGFKFRDYLLSVKKQRLFPMEIMGKDMSELEHLQAMVEVPQIDLKGLLDVCPFK